MNQKHQQFLLDCLQEDLGEGDLTCQALQEDLQKTVQGQVIAKENGVICGQEIPPFLLNNLDKQAQYEVLVNDGADAEQGQVVARFQAEASAILGAERVFLNFMQRLSGIATMTRAFKQEIADLNVSILGTRKTTPGLRYFERMAIAAGGGENHRWGLNDQILIKENHLHVGATGKDYLEYLKEAVAKAKKHGLVEVEVENFDEAMVAFNADADIILLDNMKPEDMARTVQAVRLKSKDKPLFEASGNISLSTVRQVALTGVERISVGSLTHSYPSLDLSLLIA